MDNQEQKMGMFHPTLGKIIFTLLLPICAIGVMMLVLSSGLGGGDSILMNPILMTIVYFPLFVISIPLIFLVRFIGPLAAFLGSFVYFYVLVCLVSFLWRNGFKGFGLVKKSASNSK